MKITDVQGRTSLRGRLLAGAATAVMIAIAPTAANAQASAGVSGGTGTVVGQGDNQQNNGAAVSATVNNATMSSTGSMDQTDTAVSANLISASASGNVYGPSTFPLSLLDPAGVGALSFQVNSAAVTGGVTGNSILEALTVFTASSGAASDNRISASASGNSSSQVVNGDVPDTFAGSGTPSFSYSGDVLLLGSQTSGDIALATVQQDSGAGSSATADDNSILLTVNTAGGSNGFSSSVNVNGNDVAADYSANSSSSRIAIGGNPSFNGSAALLNDQVASGANAATSASNSGTLIRGTIGTGGAGALRDFAGALSVSGNTVTSSASGNNAVGPNVNGAPTAGNSITIAAGMSVQGSSTTSFAGAADAFGGHLAGAAADVTLTSSQVNDGTGILSAATTGARVTGNVQSSIGGMLDVSDNVISASSSANAANSSISNGGNSSSIDASVALVNFQSSTNAGASATADDNRIRGLVGANLASASVEDTTVTVDGNRISASASGNSSAQSISLDGDLLGSGTANGLYGATGSFVPAAAGGLGNTLLVNVQSNNGSPITASNTDGRIDIDADTPNGTQVLGSQLSVSDNGQRATAFGNSATSSLALDGNSVGTGAGLVSQQSNDANSPVSADVSGTMAISTRRTLNASSATLAGNDQRAVAAGNAVTNSMNVSSGATAVDPTGAGPVSGTNVTGLSGGYVNAAFGLVSNQSQLGDVTATAGSDSAGNAALSIDIGNRITNGGTASITGNHVGAEAYGNDSDSDLGFDVGNLTMTGDGNANVLGLQSTQLNGGSVSALVDFDGSVAFVSVDDDVLDGTVTLTDNDIDSIAFGNRALAANTVTATGTNITTSQGAGSTVGSLDLNGDADAAFTAQTWQTNSGGLVSAIITEGLGGYDAEATVGGDLDASTVTVSGNTTRAAATSNSATTGLSLAANGLTTTAAVQNVQDSTADVTASVGVAASGAGGAQAVIDGSITGSSVTVSGNRGIAAAVGNSSTSSLDVSGTNVTAAGRNASASADSATGTANADFTLGNSQTVTGTISASGYGNYLVRVPSAGTTDVTNSTLAVTDNREISNAFGNTASNSLSLSGTNMTLSGRNPANSALVSVQDANATLSATTLAGFYGPGQVDGSGLLIDGNQSLALAIMNDVSNLLDVAASANMDGTNGASADTSGAATADHVLDNAQSASGSVASSATGVYRSLDGNVGAGTTDSTLAITNNVTSAAAFANRAVNTANVGGGSSTDGSAALLNTQTSSAGVSATAVTNGANPSFAITGTGAVGSSGVSNSSLVLNNNSTTALASGNSAANVLNYGGGSLGAQGAAGSSSATPATGSAVILNSQSNSGAVTATATNVSYMMALNGAGQPAATNSSFAVSGNVISAAAFGNSAVNSVNMSGLNMAGATANVTNIQNNTAAVTASASGSITMGATGMVNTSSMGISGNAITATAVGNSAASTITGH